MRPMAHQKDRDPVNLVATKEASIAEWQHGPCEPFCQSYEAEQLKDSKKSAFETKVSSLKQAQNTKVHLPRFTPDDNRKVRKVWSDLSVSFLTPDRIQT